MRKLMPLITLFCFVCAVVLVSASAFAAQKTFVVSSFAINAPKSYSYLGKAIPGTIQSKLNKPGVLKGIVDSGRVSSEADARKAMSRAKADYAVWGTVHVVGNDCTIEINSVGKDGKTWSKSESAPMSALTGTVQNLAAALGSEALGVHVAATPVFSSRGGGAPAVNQMNRDIVVNETGQQQVYLNPQFRYQGAGSSDGSRLRSQRLKEYMVDMALGDFNGDGKTEIAVLGEHDLIVFIWGDDGKLKELGRTTISRTNRNFSMRAMDINRDKVDDLVIATFEEDSNRPYAYFYSFRGGKFSQLAPRASYFASVWRMPPTFSPVLVGQGFDSIKMFAPGVHEMVKGKDGKFALGQRIQVPSGANVFNVAWIPADKNQNRDLLVMLTGDERIRLYTGNASSSPLHTTMDRFSGSATGMDFYKTFPGLGENKDADLPSKYYAPMRLISADIGHTGENVLLLNKPISTASQFFDRYRYFPEGEIHALFWDGVGLALKWKTRRIRGSVAEIDLGDVNNDGILDLVVGINTSPSLGVGSRQSMITAYPLDVSQVNPNTPADLSDFEVTPN